MRPSCAHTLASLPQLRELNLFYSGISDAGAAQLSRLARFGQLRSLNLDSRGVTDACMPAIATVAWQGRTERAQETLAADCTKQA